MPDSPLPSGARPPRPLSRTSSVVRSPSSARRIQHRVASACRTTLVTASRKRVGEGAILLGGKVGGDDGDLGRDARGDQHALGVGDLVEEPLGPVTAHGLADLDERLARDALDVANLRDGARRVAVRELGGQLRLQHDHRQRVAEQVVQVTADPLALGDAGHFLDGLLSHAQVGILAMHRGKVDVGAADNGRDDQRRQPCPNRHGKQPGLEHDARQHHDEPAKRDPGRSGEAQKRGSIDEEAVAGRVHRHHDQADCVDGPGDDQQLAAVRSEAPEVEGQEYRHRPQRPGPLPDPAVIERGCRDEEHQVHEPRVRRPAQLAPRVAHGPHFIRTSLQAAMLRASELPRSPAVRGGGAQPTHDAE